MRGRGLNRVEQEHGLDRLTLLFQLARSVERDFPAGAQSAQ